MLKVELHTAEFPDIFTRFHEVIGERHWRKPVGQVKDAIRGNRYLRKLMAEE